MTIQTAISDPPRIAFNELIVHETTKVLSETNVSRKVNLNDRSAKRLNIPTEKIIRSRQTTLPTMVIEAKTLVAESENAAPLKLESEPKKIRAVDPVELISHLANRTNSNGRITGKLSLEDGLYLGDGYLDLQLLRHGVAESSGRVNAKHGTFEIEVPEKTGTLVATLYSRAGEKLGEGSVRISQTERSSQITVGPIQNKTAVHYRSFDALLAQNGGKKQYGDKGLPAKGLLDSLGSEMSADSSGLAEVKNMTKGSWSLARGVLAEYKQSIVLARAGARSEVTLFREGFTDALLNIAADLKRKSDLPETNSIVWGQSLYDGKPTSGVHVEVEFEPNLQVVYFNSLLLPDPSLTATGENGYFAILNSAEGWHSVVGMRGDQYFSHTNVVTEADVVSPIELVATGQVEQVEVRSFDAFTGEPQPTFLDMQSLPQQLALDGYSQISLPQIERLSLLRSQPRDSKYLRTQSIYEDSQDSIFIPLVKQQWIESILLAKNITQNPESGTVVGFVQGEAFEVFLPKVENYSSENVVYFNGRGETVDKGEPGGGFILFNVPRSTQSIVVVSKISNLASSQIIPIDPNVVSAMNYQF